MLFNFFFNNYILRKLAGRTIFITGASRGIGKAIALKAARDGANIVIAAKTTEPHPKLPGTIYTAAKEGTLWELVLLDFCVVWQRGYFDPVTRRRIGGACTNPYFFPGMFNILVDRRRNPNKRWIFYFEMFCNLSSNK